VGFISIEALGLAVKSTGLSFVFHQLVSIPTLILACLINGLLRRRHKIVYDLHDLIDERSFKLRLYRILEGVLPYFDVSWITVSKFHAEILKQKYGVLARPVYGCSAEPSTKQEILGSVDGASLNRKVVYFGVIAPDRINLHDIETLVSLGYVFDIYGKWVVDQGGGWGTALKDLVASSGGKIWGRYRPGDLGFLSGYRYLLITYKGSENNIRGCMPNKLFQALGAGLICVVSDSMQEIRETFGSTGFVVSFQDLIANTMALESQDPVRLKQRFHEIHLLSRENFFRSVRLN
jgi:hypothetical protein